MSYIHTKENLQRQNKRNNSSIEQQYGMYSYSTQCARKEPTLTNTRKTQLTCRRDSRRTSYRPSAGRFEDPEGASALLVGQKRRQHHYHRNHGLLSLRWATPTIELGTLGLAPGFGKWRLPSLGPSVPPDRDPSRWRLEGGARARHATTRLLPPRGEYSPRRDSRSQRHGEADSSH